MRKSTGLFAAIVIGLGLAFAISSSGLAVPLDGAKLPESLQRLMENPVIQVKKKCDEGYKLYCEKKCDKYKKSDYCKMEEHMSDPSCCKHYKNVCKCLPEKM